VGGYTMKRNVINQTAITLFVFTVFVSVLSFQGSLAYGQEWTAAQKEIWSMQKKAWELWKKGEKDAFDELFHEDCILRISRFKDALIKKDLWGLPSWIESFDLQPSVVKVSGDVAIIRYISNYETPSWKSKARFTNVWKKQNGRWKILLQMANDCEKPTPPCP
jgi:hypothetical protein